MCILQHFISSTTPFFKLINQVFIFQATETLNHCFTMIIILIKIYAFILVVVDMPQS